MRFSGVLTVGVLIAAAVALYLTSRDATSSLDAFAAVASDLRAEGVVGTSLDRDVAQQMLFAMDDLLARPDTIPVHVDSL